MGLDVSHGAWRGSYGMFMCFRKVLTKAIGMPPLKFMEGFYEGSFHELYDLTPTLTDELNELHSHLPIRWDVLKDDPLHVLLNHSDCDGEIPVKALQPLANRLEEVADAGMPNPEGWARWAEDPHIWERLARTFATGCRQAYLKNEPLTFC